MNEAGQDRATRREFFRGSARYTVLAALGAVSALLFKRSGGKISGQTCTNQGICSGCTTYAGCALPPALSRKQSEFRSSLRGEARTSRAERGVHAASTPVGASTLQRAEARAPEVT